MTPVVTRFTVGVGRCTRCTKRVQGRHLEQTSDALGAAASQIGPHARGLATWLHDALGLSFAKTSAVLSHLGVPVTAGALSQGAQSTGTDLVPIHQTIVEKLNDAAMVATDEIGWRVGGRGAWLWAATSKEATAYNVAEGRGFEPATALLAEDYDGTLVRYGWVVYPNYDKAAHQTCVAHLVRRCAEKESDLPDWARGTPRQVNEILLVAIDARELSAAQRRPWSKTSPNGSSFSGKAPTPTTPTAGWSSTSWPRPMPSSPSSTTRTSTPPTGGANRPSGLRLCWFTGPRGWVSARQLQLHVVGRLQVHVRT